MGRVTLDPKMLCNLDSQRYRSIHPRNGQICGKAASKLQLRQRKEGNLLCRGVRLSMRRCTDKAASLTASLRAVPCPGPWTDLQLLLFERRVWCFLCGSGGQDDPLHSAVRITRSRKGGGTACLEIEHLQDFVG